MNFRTLVRGPSRGVTRVLLAGLVPAVAVALLLALVLALVAMLPIWLFHRARSGRPNASPAHARVLLGRASGWPPMASGPGRDAPGVEPVQQTGMLALPAEQVRPGLRQAEQLPQEGPGQALGGGLHLGVQDRPPR